jgi:tetratricopeptide (TPR) repeat protein
MIRKDQTSALVQQMNELLPRLEKFKKQQLYKEAIDDINETVRTNLGLAPRFVKGITGQDLLGMVHSGLISAERTVALAKLLKERADINWAQGQPNNGLIRTVKALALYLEVFDKQKDGIFADYFSDVELLAANAADHPLPGETRKKLFCFYEARGQYSKAEDILFEALEASGEGEWLVMGRQFYDRLAQKNDQELEAGNLPREELEESRTDLARLEARA